jgi:hypothetical protein
MAWVTWAVRIVGEPSRSTIVVVVVALTASVLGVVRTRRARPGPVSFPATSSASATGTRRGLGAAEVGTVVLTVITAWIAWPIVAWADNSVRGELRGGARPALIAFYLAVPAVLVVGGYVGWRRANRRRRDVLTVWRATLWGVLIPGLVIAAAGIALTLLVMYAFSRSDWQF